MDMRILIGLLRQIARLRAAEQWSPQQLQAHQASGLQQLRSYAYSRSSFYQEFHAGRLSCPLNELPILTKQILMEHFDELVTDPLVFHDVLDTLPVRGWQVRQTATGLDILMAGLQDDSAVAATRQIIGGVLADLGVKVAINVVAVHDIPNDASGKRPLIKSLS